MVLLNVFTAPIFLYTSWRTGGTALALALKDNPSNMLFLDPLNIALTSLKSAEEGNSDIWDSNHPPGFNYFEEYLPIFEGEKLHEFPNMSEFKFFHSSRNFQDQLVKYVGGLIDYARKTNKTPVFKFEQLEGHVKVLRDNFSTAIHVGLIRDPIDQVSSWYEQLALGNTGFFDSASSLLMGDPDFFGQFRPTLELSNQELFDVYHDGLVALRPSFDVIFNLYEDDVEEFISKFPSDQMREIFKLALERLANLEKPPSFERKFHRMRERAVLLTQQRDELTQQRDELTQQRDELTQQRDEIVNSTIWKLTNPLRKAIDLFKK